MNTTYFLNLVAGNVFNTKTTPPLPKKFYLGVSKTPPTKAGTGATEPTDLSYSRIEMTGLSIPTNGIVKNTTDLTLPMSTVPWGVCTHFVVYDSISNGNLLMYNAMSKSRNVASEDILLIPIAEIQLSYTD